MKNEIKSKNLAKFLVGIEKVRIFALKLQRSEL